MDFFNDLGRKFTQAARSVQALTRDGAENSRLSSDLKSAQAELEQRYAELGKAYYESLGSPDAEIPGALIERVRAALSRIDELTVQRDRRVRCPSCGFVLSPEARFCSNCGKRMPEDAPVPAEADSDAEYCPECGAMRKDEDAFCAVCGRSFAPETEPPAIPLPPRPAFPRPEPLEEPERFDE